MKLALAAVVIAGTSGYMAYLGASSSWKYYVTADECVALRDQLTGRRMRISGQIAPGTLQVSGDRSRAAFVLRGQANRLDVVCTGVVPDNLHEGADVVVEGQLEPNGSLAGDKLLTKCASKYAPDQEPPVGPAEGSKKQ
jgi:cytochrome c-type biogenesis protein CcmE